MTKLLNPADVAERLGCQLNTARKLMKEMPHISISPSGAAHPRICVDERDLEQWILGRKQYPAPEPVSRRKQKKTDPQPWPYTLEYRKAPKKAQ